MPDASTVVCSALSELLGTTDLNITTSFLQLGGTSILAMKAAAQISGELAVEVKLVDVLFCSSITSLINDLTRDASTTGTTGTTGTTD